MYSLKYKNILVNKLNWGLNWATATDYQDLTLKEMKQNLQSGPAWGMQQINGPFPIAGHMITFLFTRKQLIFQKLFQQGQVSVACISDNSLPWVVFSSQQPLSQPAFYICCPVTPLPENPGCNFDWLIVQKFA